MHYSCSFRRAHAPVLTSALNGEARDCNAKSDTMHALLAVFCIGLGEAGTYWMIKDGKLVNQFCFDGNEASPGKFYPRLGN